MSEVVARTTRRPPLAVVGAATLTVVFFALPLLGLLQRAAWSSLWTDLTTPEALSALRLSLVCSLSATALSVLLGFPLAWTLARIAFPGKALVRALVLVPLVLPPVVGGVALVSAFSPGGAAGRYLFDWFGVQLPSSTTGVIVAETFVALPFFVITVEAALRSMDSRFEDVAATLGAGRWYTFRRVSLPLIVPSVVAGAVLSWARALGEFGATITFAGRIEGTTETLPLAIYRLLDRRPDTAVAMSLALLAISLVVLVALRGRWLERA
ncbi:MAG: molybdate ABC transporter permease subunit [Actinobacteria bacterium]|nr:molybdate ABC transporter permease subunit [Actinomycetota bacterium]